MQKYIKKLACLGIALSVFTSCDDFGDTNKDPNSVTDPVVENLFSYNIMRVSGTGFENHRANLIYCGAMIQHFASLTGYWSGDKYLYSDQYSGAYFGTAYGSQAKEIEQIISVLKDQPEKSNMYNIARIWRVVIYHRLTDLYGDVPYSEAAKGYLESVFSPKYDKQSDIYTNMLQELEQAAAALNVSAGSYGAADFIYGGDVAKWKKYAYSMMLRLGMRLTKVDATMAESYVKKAIAGGLFQSNEDLAFIPHTDGPTDLNRNMDGRQLYTQELDPTNFQGARANSKLSKTFVDFLKNNDDPRLPIYSTLWQGNANPLDLPTSSDPAVQKGLPNGYDDNTIKTLIPGWGTTENLANYSEPNLNTVASSAAPTMMQTYAEVEFLLAEAVLRGWGDGDVSGHFTKGVRAAMEMMSMYPGNSTVAAEDIQDYLAANPLVVGTMEQQMEQIHTQFWVACFLNSYEAYANWRRTGYPTLTPVNYPGNETGGVIPRRLIYPQNEASINATQYQAAVAQQGNDLFTTRIWWDKQ